MHGCFRSVTRFRSYIILRHMLQRSVRLFQIKLANQLFLLRCQQCCNYSSTVNCSSTIIINENEKTSTPPLIYNSRRIAVDEEQCDYILANLSKLNFNCESNKLAYFPLACDEFNKTVDERVLKNWWSLLQRRSKDVDNRIFVYTLNGLKKINSKDNNIVLKCLGWKCIISVTEHALKSLTYHDNKSLSVLVTSLEHFDQTLMTDNERNNFNSILRNFMQLMIEITGVDSNKYYSAYLDGYSFGRILYKLSKLNIETPSEDSIKEILTIYSKNFGLSRGSLTFSCYYLRDLDYLARAFLKWNINADEFVEKFWSKLFLEIPRHFPFLINDTTVQRSELLGTYLLIALNFDQEIQFAKIKFLWSDIFELSKDTMTKDEAKSLSDLIVEKYNGKTEKIDEAGLTNVLNALNAYINIAKK